MWRSTVFPENENSDQSISEEDDDYDMNEDRVSFGVPPQKKGEVQILSQLDMLRDANEVVHERSHSSLFQKRQAADVCVEDDVEFPLFANNDEFTFTPEKVSAPNSDEEILSDDEGKGNCMQLSKCFTVETDEYQKCGPSSFGGNRKDGICTWLAENAEADALVNVNDNADCAPFRPVSAKAKRSGGKDKAKHKFSFKRQSHTDIFKDVSHVFESDALIKGKEVDDMNNYLMPAEMPVSRTHTTTSMAELLVHVHAERDLAEASIVEYNGTKGTSRQLAVERSILPQDHSDIDDDLDCLRSDSSEEDEYNHQALQLAMPESKQKTIADQFHEALGAASTNDEEHVYAVPRNTGVGLFGKLQRVMHREKERDAYFLNKLPSEDEASCFDVKIMSTSLEGKLIVCSCSSIDNEGTVTNTNSPRNVVKRKQMTIIFSSRVCSDVELDVGTLERSKCKREGREYHFIYIFLTDMSKQQYLRCYCTLSLRIRTRLRKAHIYCYTKFPMYTSRGDFYELLTQ